jgi:non-ribosomal peptide synthetase-like protein
LTGYSDAQTINPSLRLYGLRLFIEFFRIILPTAFAFIFLFNMFYAIDYLQEHASLLTMFFVLPVIDCAANIGLVGLLILLKWVLLGRIQATIRPVWDVLIWKNDIREYSYSYFINQHLTNIILGTPFVAYLFRAMGAKVGKRVVFDSAEFAEFDLINIGDEVCINSEALIQTHLYEDRIFKLSNLVIGDRCNVGTASMVLYDTIMHENSTLGSLSVLMKGEDLPHNTCWQGVPAQSIMSHQLARDSETMRLDESDESDDSDAIESEELVS